MIVNPATGMWWGRFEHPELRNPAVTMGVIFPKQGLAGGYFNIGGKTGSILLLPEIARETRLER